VDEAEEQVRAAAPAHRVTVGVLLRSVPDALFLEVLLDGLADLVRVFAGQPVEAVDEDAGLVDRRDHRQVVLLAERIVLLTGAWRDVDDPGTFLGPDVAPGNHAMLDAVLGRKLVERPAVALADQLRALHFADDLVLTPDRVLHRVPGDVVRLAVLAHEDVGDIR